MSGETCKFCEQEKRRTRGDYRVKDAFVTTYPCVEHLQEAIGTALVMTDEVNVRKWNRD